MIDTLINVVVIVLSIWTLGKINLLEYISFIPESYVYEAGIATYSAVLLGIYNSCVKKWIASKFRSEIECVFYRSGDDKNIDSSPFCSFNSDITKLRCWIRVKGNAKRLRNKKIVLILPDWIDVQTSNQVAISSERNKCVISVSKMVDGKNGMVRGTETDFELSLITEPKRDSFTDTIEPVLEGKAKFLTAFTYNSFKIKYEGK